MIATLVAIIIAVLAEFVPDGPYRGRERSG